MSQQPKVFEYKFLMLSEASRDMLAKATMPNAFALWVDEQNEKLSQLMAEQNSGWEIISFDVIGPVPYFSVIVLLRRPMHAQS